MLQITGFDQVEHNEPWHKNMELFKYFTDISQGVRRSGAAAADMAHVACGACMQQCTCGLSGARHLRQHGPFWSWDRGQGEYMPLVYLQSGMQQCPREALSQQIKYLEVSICRHAQCRQPIVCRQAGLCPCLLSSQHSCWPRIGQEVLK